jgi:selenocysteine lyase/cysteine desulfurase
MGKGFNRRDFLKGLTASALSAGLLGGSEAKALVTPSCNNQTLYDLPNSLQNHPTISGRKGTERYWSNVRKTFILSDDYIHMNTGTTGSQPLFSLVNLAVYNLYKLMDPRDWQTNLNEQYPDLFPMVSNSAMTARQTAIAAQYGANADEIVLSYNTTDACNLIFAGTPWQPGDRIITTHWEHPAIAGPTAWARDYMGVDVHVVEMPSNFTASITKDDVLSLFEAELQNSLGSGNKQYIAISEVFYKNGLRMPVKEICRLAKSYGAYTIIDTAHGWGQIPINCHDYEADFICGAGHKWLCGGPGTGICYVRKSYDDSELPPFTMGNWFLYGNVFTAPSENYNSRTWSPATYMQLRGETNTPALYAMTDSAAYFNYIGVEDIYDRGVALGNYLKDKIASRWGDNALWVQQNPDTAFATAITSFNPFEGKDNTFDFSAMNTAMSTVLSTLASETPKIYIRTVTWRDKKTDSSDNRIGFRVSTHGVYNNYDEIDYMFRRLAAAINATGLPQLG